MPRAKTPTRKQSTLEQAGFKRGVAHASTIRKPSAVGVGARVKARAAAAVSTASDRVRTDVLLAIQPIHLADIAARRKNHEYRKYRLRDGVERLWFYETKGGEVSQGKGRAAITHVATIPADTRHTPGDVPEEPFGIGNADFNAGLKQSKYGYPIVELYKLVQPITLDEMKTRWQLGGAPMGWSYVKTDMWQDRWGEEGSRGERMEQVF